MNADSPFASYLRKPRFAVSTMADAPTEADAPDTTPPVLSLAPAPTLQRDSGGAASLGLLSALGALLGGRADLAGRFGASAMQGYRGGEDAKFARDTRAWQENRQNDIAQNSDAWRRTQYDRQLDRDNVADQRYQQGLDYRAGRDATLDERFRVSAEQRAAAAALAQRLKQDNEAARERQRFFSALLGIAPEGRQSFVNAYGQAGDLDRMKLGTTQDESGNWQVGGVDMGALNKPASGVWSPEAVAAKKDVDAGRSQDRIALKTIADFNRKASDPRTPPAMAKELAKRVGIIVDARQSGQPVPSWVYNTEGSQLPMTPAQKEGFRQRELDRSQRGSQFTQRQAQQQGQFREMMDFRTMDQALDFAKGTKQPSATTLLNIGKSLDGWEQKIMNDASLSDDDKQIWLSRVNERRSELESIRGKPVTLNPELKGALGAAFGVQSPPPAPVQPAPKWTPPPGAPAPKPTPAPKMMGAIKDIRNAKTGDLLKRLAQKYGNK